MVVAAPARTIFRLNFLSNLVLLRKQEPRVTNADLLGPGFLLSQEHGSLFDGE